MHRAIVAVLLAVAVSACGGSDPIGDCKTLMEVGCNRAFECAPTGSAILYGTVSECIANRSALACTPERTACPSGYSFNSGNSQRCIDEFRTASCTDLGAGFVPDSCNQVCTR